ncbi:hypothetical protein HCN51_45690 [Nonomuraea sp. FMUSA5-5]|uniref:Uncharacterized protein n=1 Tax=Nonomuraea composti TaxID=2720023 RepID=A0ABX1BLI6_9ACTN|nr:hypothetical protein [Nonomuraea sp. FMUSA5-5]NJP96646.1 hypothetical protein [Nonomuraea sp. FMUSA5-5]
MDRSNASLFYMIHTDGRNMNRSLQPTETLGVVWERERLAILELAKRHPDWTPQDIRKELMRSEREMVRQLGGELLLRLIEVVTGQKGPGTSRIPLP